MNDRELLELAAKAAGHVWSELDAKCLEYGDIAPIHWNPLTDDGAALRLAVKLRLSITMGKDAFEAHQGSKDGCLEVSRTDPYAATRRAIVRAAAEIGRSMR